MTNNDSPVHKMFLVLTFCHKYQEIPHAVNSGNARGIIWIFSKLEQGH